MCLCACAQVWSSSAGRLLRDPSVHQWRAGQDRGMPLRGGNLRVMKCVSGRAAIDGPTAGRICRHWRCRLCWRLVVAASLLFWSLNRGLLEAVAWGRMSWDGSGWWAAVVEFLLTGHACYEIKLILVTLFNGVEKSPLYSNYWEFTTLRHDALRWALGDQIFCKQSQRVPVTIVLDNTMFLLPSWCSILSEKIS